MSSKALVLMMEFTLVHAFYLCKCFRVLRLLVSSKTVLNYLSCISILNTMILTASTICAHCSVRSRGIVSPISLH